LHFAINLLEEMTMRRFVLAAFATTVLAGCQPTPQPLEQVNPLEGVWSITEVAYTGTDTSFTFTSPPPGAFIFTEHHYSLLYVWGEEPRQLLPEEPSDAERLAAMQRLRASLGIYELSDSTITITRMVSRFPNQEGGSATIGYRVEGDSLWLKWGTAENPIDYTLVRVE
jgi:hypothetical protein